MSNRSRKYYYVLQEPEEEFGTMQLLVISDTKIMKSQFREIMRECSREAREELQDWSDRRKKWLESNPEWLARMKSLREQLLPGIGEDSEALLRQAYRLHTGDEMRTSDVWELMKGKLESEGCEVRGVRFSSAIVRGLLNVVELLET